MSDLSKFGVPLEGQNLGILQPKLTYRFRVVFHDFGEGQGMRELTQNVQKVTRPKLNHAEVQVHSYNSRAYIAGKHEWEAITVDLRDDITNAVVSTVGKQVQKQINHFEQTAAVAGSNYKFGMEVHALDGTTGDELESWVIDGCWIKDIKYPESDYTQPDQMQMVSMTIRYDNATHIAGPNTNDGTTVGGNPFNNIPSRTGGTNALGGFQEKF